MTELDRLTSAIMGDFPDPRGANAASEIRTKNGVIYNVVIYPDMTSQPFNVHGVSALECYQKLVKQGCYPIEEPKK